MKNLHVPNQASEFPYFEHMSLSGQAELTALWDALSPERRLLYISRDASASAEMGELIKACGREASPAGLPDCESVLFALREPAMV
ncbi:MAG TPA: hypothetical protein VJJ47_00120 [Candidatus Paceibacterota bacterium]